MERHRTRIRQVYSSLSELLRKPDCPKEIPTAFIDLVTVGNLEARACKDEDLLKLAVISSHKEWEWIYREPIAGTDQCIGDLAREVCDEALPEFRLNAVQTRFLRDEVLGDNSKFSDLTEAIKQGQIAAAENPTIDGYMVLARSMIEFDIIDDAMMQLTFAREIDGNDLFLKLSYPLFLAHASLQSGWVGDDPLVSLH